MVIGIGVVSLVLDILTCVYSASLNGMQRESSLVSELWLPCRSGYLAIEHAQFTKAGPDHSWEWSWKGPWFDPSSWQDRRNNLTDWPEFRAKSLDDFHLSAAGVEIFHDQTGIPKYSGVAVPFYPFWITAGILLLVRWRRRRMKAPAAFEVIPTEHKLI